MTLRFHRKCESEVLEVFMVSLAEETHRDGMTMSWIVNSHHRDDGLC